MKQLLKKIIPRFIRNRLHLAYAFFGALRYGRPSNELFVIGVTGTSGKSTTILLLRHFLEAAGYTVGSLSTVDFYVAGESKLNDQKMTMLGRAKIQEYLRHMVDKGCDVAIVEATSEGAVQFRHVFINFDVMVLTNFYPEHIESHGSFDNYKAAKKSIFQYAASCTPKFRLGKYDRVALCDEKTCTEPYEEIPKVAVVNGNVQYAEEFLAYPFGRRILFGNKQEPWYGAESTAYPAIDAQSEVDDISMNKDGLAFTIDGETIATPMYGVHNAGNLAATISVCRSMGVSWDVIRDAARTIPSTPGRIEFISEAQACGIIALVDFAFEPVALRGVYDVVALFEPKRVIHVLGGTGGGRDVSRREPMGAIAAQKADIVIVTNEDPYDEDPMEIMQMVATGARSAGAVDDETLFVVSDRGEAIEQAITMAKEGDLVLVTGKGSEQAMCLANGKMIPWDDREEVRKALSKRA